MRPGPWPDHDHDAANQMGIHGHVVKPLWQFMARGPARAHPGPSAANIPFNASDVTL